MVIPQAIYMERKMGSKKLQIDMAELGAISEAILSAEHPEEKGGILKVTEMEVYPTILVCNNPEENWNFRRLHHVNHFADRNEYVCFNNEPCYMAEMEMLAKWKQYRPIPLEELRNYQWYIFSKRYIKQMTTQRCLILFDNYQIHYFGKNHPPRNWGSVVYIQPLPDIKN